MKQSIQIAIMGDILAGNYLSKFLAENKSDPHIKVWGDMLPLLNNIPYKFANLETSICDATFKSWPEKKWTFRIDREPAKKALQVVGFNYLSLGNNHSFDYGKEGLEQTLDIINSLKIPHSGASIDKEHAFCPSVIETPVGRLGVYSFAFPECHLSEKYDADGLDLMGATATRAGVNLLYDFSESGLDTLCRKLQEDKKRLALDHTFSFMHWGKNYPEPIDNPQFPWLPEDRLRELSYKLIDMGGLSTIIGCSSHHIHGIERYKKGVIFYGTGDFLSDYYLDPDFYKVPQAFRGNHQKFSSAYCSFVYILELSKDGIVSILPIPTCTTSLMVRRILPSEPLYYRHFNCFTTLCNSVFASEKKDLLI